MPIIPIIMEKVENIFTKELKKSEITGKNESSLKLICWKVIILYIMVV